MRVNGTFQIDAPRERVWDSFWDPALMQAWLPGCRQAQWDGEERVFGQVEQSVAQLKALFAFDMRVTEREPPGRIRLRGEGRGLTVSSDVAIDITIELEPIAVNGTLQGAADGAVTRTANDPASGTRVTYVMDSAITGTLAKVGNFLLRLKTKELQKLLAAEVKRALEGGG